MRSRVTSRLCHKLRILKKPPMMRQILTILRGYSALKQSLRMTSDSQKKHHHSMKTTSSAPAWAFMFAHFSGGWLAVTMNLVISERYNPYHLGERVYQAFRWRGIGTGRMRTRINEQWLRVTSDSFRRIFATPKHQHNVYL